MLFSVLALGLASLTVWYVVSLVRTYFRNRQYASSSLRIPFVSLPLVDQHAFPWMVFAPMSLPLLKRRLPAWLYSKVQMGIYGWENRVRWKPYEATIFPQLRANPQLQGAGKTFALATSGRFELYSWDSDFAREVLARPNEFVQFEITSFVMGVFGNNVLTTDGDVWRRHRRVVAGAVTERVSGVVFAESIRQANMLMNAVCDKNLDGRLSNGATNRMFDHLKRVAIHVLYAAGMGEPQEWNNMEDPKISADRDFQITYIDAVKSVNENAAGPLVLPVWLLTRWPSWLPGQETMKTLGQAKAEFPLHTQLALDQEKERARTSGQQRNNVMSALIAASDAGDGDLEEGGKPRARKGPALSDQELVANLYVFTAAGFDTTANTMAFATVLLMRFPKWQDWLFEELREILPEDPAQVPDYAAVYPRALRTLSLMLEILRLYSAILHIGKQTKTTVRVKTSTGVFDVPPDTTVYLNPYALHTDPEVWRDLNISEKEKAAGEEEKKVDGLEDEMRFRPSRWINPAGSAQPIYKPAAGSYIPWSSGPRVCPGQKMAQVEFVAVFLTLFRHHRVEAIPLQLNSGDDDTTHHEKKSGTTRTETRDEVNARLDHLSSDCIAKLTLEMQGIYNIDEENDGNAPDKVWRKSDTQGLPLRWIRRN